MCDSYGAPGTKTNIDIEDLDRKGQALMNREFEKPTPDDLVKFKPFVEYILNSESLISNSEMSRLKRTFKFNHKNSFLFQVYLDLLSQGEVSNEHEAKLRKTLQIKAVKSHSGITSITVFTAPYPEYTNELGEKVKQPFSCEHNCSFCPSQPGQPKSYLLLEPAVIRANKENFDCVGQMHSRLNGLYMIGHDCLKLEINVLGGTFASYPNEYREEFVRDIYYAANIFLSNNSFERERLSLSEEKKINETARTRIVLLAIECRPDSITPDELRFLRYLSVTRIQIGIQHLDDEVLRKNNRKCTTERTVKAIEMLRRVGYKMDSHIMNNLPFTTVEKDRKMLLEDLVGLKSLVKREIKNQPTFWQKLMGIKTELEYWEYYDLQNTGIQTDQLKIYPTAVTIYTDIEKWYREGVYQPYDESHLIDMLVTFKSMIFPWIRINRIMRDFYVDNIYSKSGSNMSMRCELVDILKKEGGTCRCTRCREAKSAIWDGTYILVIRKYNASNGEEYFISAENKDNTVLYGFARLRLDDAKDKIFPELNGAALLRELHIYSTVTYLGQQGNVQHNGLGTRLMKKAEDISKSNRYKKMAVIASVGSRTFYEKIGYALDPGEGEYMIKLLKN
jgi:histone acetyltransferase (RNA polymerase elongator complex component)